MANDYGRSVNDGIEELKAYLDNLHSNCRDTKIILSGYSQGAQVIGQSLGQLSPEIRANITFVALFGDPKLFLPEGLPVNGLFTPPPACTDSTSRSPWRRNIDNCLIYQGSLGARFPYLPADMEQKVGLWCVSGDHICGSLQNVNIPSTHGEYRTPAGPIDQATLEIAIRLGQEGLAASAVLDPDDYTGAVGPQVMLMIDSETLHNGSRFLAVQQPLITSIEDNVALMGGGVGLSNYGRTCLLYRSKISVGPGMHDYIYPHIFELSYPCTSFLPTLTLNNAIQENLVWSWDDGRFPDSKKVFVVISERPYSQLAELASSYHATTANHLQQTQDEFVIYPIVPQDVAQSYENLDVDGSETLIFDANNPNEFLWQLQQHVVRQQVQPYFDSPDYKATPGQTITFSAENSLVYDDEIVEYRWNLTGNEQTTTQPTIQHTYNVPFAGEVYLTVRTASGIEETATARVTVQNTEAFLPPLGAPTDLQVAATSSNSAQLSWRPNELADRWLVTLSGIPLGYTHDTSITVTDIENWRDNTFAVYGVLSDGRVGEKAEAVLGAYTFSTESTTNLPQNTRNKTTNSSYSHTSSLPSLLTNNSSSPHGISQLFNTPSTTATYGNPSVNYTNALTGVLAIAALLFSARLALRKLHKTK